MFIKQSTLKRSGFINGFGLHSGKKVNLRLKPSIIDSGIIFRRVDFFFYKDIPALLQNVISTQLSTNLMKSNIFVKTVEHLLSAISIMGVDNIIIELDSGEVPILDGSSYPFIYLIYQCGIKFLSKPKKFLRIKNNIKFTYKNRIVSLKPCYGFKFFISLKKKHDVFFLKQINDFSFYLNINNYIYLISRAKTFGYFRQYKILLLKKLALGAKKNNVLVLYKKKYLNRYILRYNNEIIRHKVLDILGDISLLGKSVLGSYYGFLSGHFLNINLLNILLYKIYIYDIVLIYKK